MIDETRPRAIRRVIENRDELRTSVVQVVGLATRTLSILTRDLEPEIYGHDRFLEAVKHFVLARSFSRVRVLISEPTRTMRAGHRFVTLARRLSSYIEFRHLGAEFTPRAEAFLLADDTALVYRADASRYEGLCGTWEPAATRRHLDDFDAMWEGSEQSAELRALRV
jgi:hypothetical protein